MTASFSGEEAPLLGARNTRFDLTLNEDLRGWGLSNKGSWSRVSVAQPETQALRKDYSLCCMKRTVSICGIVTCVVSSEAGYSTYRYCARLQAPPQSLGDSSKLDPAKGFAVMGGAIVFVATCSFLIMVQVLVLASIQGFDLKKALPRIGQGTSEASIGKAISNTRNTRCSLVGEP